MLNKSQSRQSNMPQDNAPQRHDANRPVKGKSRGTIDLLEAVRQRDLQRSRRRGRHHQYVCYKTTNKA